MRETDLKDPATHFDFGRNWQSFSRLITDEHVAEARRGLARLLPHDELAGRGFFDIGCGSGLSMVAARELGAARVEGVDVDPLSVTTARALLASRYPDAGGWSVRPASVFDLSPERDGTHDVVHSWGVLHHTGDMWGALERAAALVRPGGLLVVALYRKTPLCRFWTMEKKAYTAAPAPLRAVMRGIYRAAYAAGLLATGRNPLRYIREYRSNRGMSWRHDVDDWLGGYPYQSVHPDEVVAFLDRGGFSMVRMFARPAAAMGLFGTHCDEFVAQRR